MSFTEHYEGDHVKKDEMIGHVACTENPKTAFRILITKSETKYHVNELETYRRIMFQFVINKDWGCILYFSGSRQWMIVKNVVMKLDVP